MKPTIPEVLPQLQAYVNLPENGVGGSLHLVIHDGNTRDSDVRFCIDWAIAQNDPEGERLGRILLQMSGTQRGKLANLIDWG